MAGSGQDSVPALSLKNMNTNVGGNITLQKLSEKDFDRLSEFIHSSCGIKIPPAKKVMLESRLSKRLRMLNMATFREYCDYLFSKDGMQNELTFMIDMVTTNKTDFFREPAHFEYLAQEAVPALINLYGAGLKRKFVIWSAGCSTGEEPYTIAMVLNEVAERCDGFQYLVLATDISTRVLEKAGKAIYEEDKILPVPAAMKKKYLLRGKNGNKGLVRIVPELRGKVILRRLNFMDFDFGMNEPVDIIFCRNVIIYFDRATQEKLLMRLCDHLVPGGYIFMGHSETLNGMNVPLISVAPTTYRKIYAYR